MTLDFTDRVAIVTGAGAGLGRAYALDLARRGARVVINDFGGALNGAGGSQGPADAVVDEIRAAGGQAVADGADVSNAEQVEAMVAAALATWGRIDILINNAGILRDASFAKASLDDFRKVVDVHLMGAANCSRAVWGPMKAAGYGRILMTTSNSGLYGNFGQANYGAAKMGLIGLMNVLQIEGAKSGIRINALAPAAATRMTEDILPPAMASLLSPDTVVPAAVYLVSDDAPERAILCAGGGVVSRVVISETAGVALTGDQLTAEGVAAAFAKVSDPAGATVYTDGPTQFMAQINKAAAANGVAL